MVIMEDTILTHHIMIVCFGIVAAFVDITVVILVIRILTIADIAGKVFGPLPLSLFLSGSGPIALVVLLY